jgi:hypothetical protein
MVEPLLPLAKKTAVTILMVLTDNTPIIEFVEQFSV